MRKIQMALVCFGLATLSYGFELIEVKPKNESVNEGEDVILSCKSDSNWRWCTFIHKVDFRKLFRKIAIRLETSFSTYFHVGYATKKSKLIPLIT